MNLRTLLDQYEYIPGIWDEMFDGTNTRNPYDKVLKVLHHLDVPSLHQKEKMANELFMNQGITFTVYSDDAGIERIFPFDIVPRIITSLEWQHIEKGIQQRLKALNLFLNDIYFSQQILKDKIIPAELIASCTHYSRELL